MFYVQQNIDQRGKDVAASVFRSWLLIFFFRVFDGRDYLDRESALGMKGLLIFGWHKFQGSGLIKQAIDFE